MSHVPGFDGERRAYAMLRVAAHLKGIPAEQADPLLQTALIAFDGENDASVRLQANRTLLRYTYRELPAESQVESSRKALIEGEGITVSWESESATVPALEVLEADRQVCGPIERDVES